MVDDEYDHGAVAMQFIVGLLLVSIARAQPDPEKWLAQFSSEVLRQIDGWSTLEAVNADLAEFRRQATREAATAILGSLSPKPLKVSDDPRRENQDRRAAAVSA